MTDLVIFQISTLIAFLVLARWIYILEAAVSHKGDKKWIGILLCIVSVGWTAFVLIYNVCKFIDVLG